MPKKRALLALEGAGANARAAQRSGQTAVEALDALLDAAPARSSSSSSSLPGFSLAEKADPLGDLLDEHDRLVQYYGSEAVHRLVATLASLASAAVRELAEAHGADPHVVLRHLAAAALATD